MGISKQLKVDLSSLKSILLGSNLEGISAYVDTESGELLLETDMLPEEIQNRKRFLKIPSKKILLISEKALSKWVENLLQIITEEYDEDFIIKVKTQLDQAIKQPNYEYLVIDILREQEGLDDNYFLEWLDFIEREEVSNMKQWLSSKGIELIVTNPRI